jgi:ABC-2 type transport system ATP-binding protein
MRYGDREVLHGIDLVVPHGMVVGFLGPNGAGKNTPVEILEGYRRRTGGRASVLGMDPATGGRELRERIGIVLQETGHNPDLTVRETVRQFAGYYRRPRPVEEVIALVGLGEAADRRVQALSGGQRRRLDVGLALVGDPELVFLDEPTTGFDPAARRQAWEVIAGLRQLGKTILLTTHLHGGGPGAGRPGGDHRRRPDRRRGHHGRAGHRPAHHPDPLQLARRGGPR